MATTRISALLRLELVTTWLKEMEANRTHSARGSRDQAHTALSFPGCMGLAPALLLEQSPDGAPACVLEGAPTPGLRTPVSHPPLARSLPATGRPAPPCPARALTIVAAAWPAPAPLPEELQGPEPGRKQRGGAGAGWSGGTLSEQRPGQVQIESSRQQRLGSLGRLLPGC